MSTACGVRNPSCANSTDGVAVGVHVAPRTSAAWVPCPVLPRENAVAERVYNREGRQLVQGLASAMMGTSFAVCAGRACCGGDGAGVVAVLTLPAKDPALDATPTPVFGELGTGRCEYPNGDVYDGRWDSNQRSGAGKVRRWCNLLPRAGEVCGSPGCARCAQCTYANGDVYEGEWKEDQRHGVGTVRVAGCLSCECRS